MIIKAKTYRHNITTQLINYIGRENSVEENTLPIRIFHNLFPSDELEDIVTQFAENDTHRKHPKNGVTINHEILSFSPKDAHALTPDILEDLTSVYLHLRAPDSLGFAQVHHDKDHVHVHIAISANEYKSSKSTRLSRTEYRHVRTEIERYQQDAYPEIEHSMVYLDKPERSLENQEERERLAALVAEELPEERVTEQELEEDLTGPAALLLLEYLASGAYEILTKKRRLPAILYEGKRYLLDLILDRSQAPPALDLDQAIMELDTENLGPRAQERLRRLQALQAIYLHNQQQQMELGRE